MAVFTMKKLRFIFTGFVFLGLCIASALAAAEAVSPAKDRVVLVISIDGFPAWMWRDDTLPIPTLRQLAREGAVAKAMTVSNPSVTWINHTTLVTGVNPRRHGVLYNGLLVRQGPTQPPKIEQWRDKAELVRVPTVYDRAAAAGLTVAQVDWVAVTNATSIRWNFSEIPNPKGEIEAELAATGVATAEQLANFTKNKNIAWRDMVWSRAAAHILKTRRPNLMLFHLLTTDSVNHTYGPGTVASHTAFAYADRMVKEQLDALTDAGLRDKATVLIVTDHGFKKVAKLIHPNVALKQAGLLRAAGPTVTSCDAYVMAQGGLAFAFVTDPAKRAQVLPQLRKLCEGIEGVATVMDGNDAPQLGMPTPKENQGMGDLILYAKPGYAFQASAAGADIIAEAKTYLGTHGYASTDPELDGVFLAWGRGIRAGAQLERIANLDVAPTIAQLLGVPLPDVEGRVLKEFLK